MKNTGVIVFVVLTLIATQVMASSFKGSIEMKFAEQPNTAKAIGQIKISIEEAIKIAKQRVDGVVFEAELEKENDYLVWDIDILDKNKVKREVIVDPITGEILLVIMR